MKPKTYLLDLDRAAASIETQPNYGFSVVFEWARAWKLGTITSSDEFSKSKGQLFDRENLTLYAIWYALGI